MSISRVMRRVVPVAVLLVACGDPSGRGGDGVGRRGDDLVGSGGELRVTDSVPGDVMLAGGDIEFSGGSGGSYLGAGGDQRIGGRIAESVRAAGGAVALSGTVGRNATLVGGEVTVDSAAVIERNAYLTAGRVEMMGRVGGQLAVSGGEVVLDGSVGGDVDVGAQRLRIGPRASVAGAIRHRVPTGAVTIDSAARIAGGVTALPARDWSRLIRFVTGILIVGFLIVGAVAVALFPGVALSASNALREHTGASIAFGLVCLAGGPILALIAAVTLVGLPLAAVITAVYLILVYVGRAAVAVWLGRLIVGDRVREPRALALISFLVGALGLAVVGLIPVIGGLVWLVSTIVGIGALLVAVWPRRRAADRVA